MILRTIAIVVALSLGHNAASAEDVTWRPAWSAVNASLGSVTISTAWATPKGTGFWLASRSGQIILIRTTTQAASFEWAPANAPSWQMPCEPTRNACHFGGVHSLITWDEGTSFSPYWSPANDEAHQNGSMGSNNLQILPVPTSGTKFLMSITISKGNYSNPPGVKRSIRVFDSDSFSISELSQFDLSSPKYSSLFPAFSALSNGVVIFSTQDSLYASDYQTIIRGPVRHTFAGTVLDLQPAGSRAALLWDTGVLEFLASTLAVVKTTRVPVTSKFVRFYDENVGLTGLNNRIYVTADSGQTWSPPYALRSTETVYAFRTPIFLAKNKIVYLATNPSLGSVVFDGATWRNLAFP